MNANENAGPTQVQRALRASDPELEKSRGVRIEPCEFETLLERAMEILSASARAATPSAS
jgi:hypothetical protein